jgi:hypothetical protein
MNKHTKGPWHIGAGNGEGSVFADEGRTRLEQGGTTLYSICNVTRGWNDSEDAANARLIAAAPDLLAALIECERIANELFQETGLHEYMHASDRAREAIAKATGEQV